MSSPTNDAAAYRKRSQPKASQADADNAFHVFQRLVREAAEDCGIADVYVVVQTPVEQPAPKVEGLVGVSFHVGDTRNALTMAARGYAQERQATHTMLARLLALTDGTVSE